MIISNLFVASVLSAVQSFFGLQLPNNIQKVPIVPQHEIQQSIDIFSSDQGNLVKYDSSAITDKGRSSVSGILVSPIKLLDIGLQPNPNRGENIAEFPLGQVFDMSAIFGTGGSSSEDVLNDINVEVSDPGGRVIANIELECEETQGIFYCKNNVWNTSNLSLGKKTYKFNVSGTDSGGKKITGSAVREFTFRNVSTALCKAVFPQHNSNDVSKNRFNLIFVGVGYSNVSGESFSDVFTKVAGRLLDLGATGHGLFSAEPFKGNSNLFNFWYVDRSYPLGQCTLINQPCSNEELSQSCPYPNSYLVEVHDRNAYDQEVGAFARSVVVVMPYSRVSDPTQSAEADSLQRTFTHEFGHTFANLGDEYVVFPDQTASPVYISIQKLRSIFQAQKNIFYGSLTECQQDAPWHGLPGTNCFEGAGKIGLNAFRPTDNSLMRDQFLDPFTFGPYNSLLIRDSFDRFLSKSRLISGATSTSTATGVLPTISSFNALPSEIVSGQISQLSWVTGNATRCIIQSGSGEESVSVNGSKRFNPTQTTSYKLWCVNDPGTGKDGLSAERSISVVVKSPSPSAIPTCSLISDKSSYMLGERITYSWTSKNATYASWQNADSGGGYTWLPSDKLPASGSQQLIASDIGKVGVGLQVAGPNGSGSCSHTVIITAVTNPPPTTLDSITFYPGDLKVMPGSSFRLSGGTSGTGTYTVAIVGPNYAGNTDWNMVGNLLKGGSNYTAVSKVISANGDGIGWLASFGGIATEGYYTVIVYDSSYNILGKATLWVTYKG